MGFRVTQRLIIDRVLNSLTDHQRRILDLQEQLSTGQRVNKPSDDPLAARRAVAARSEIAKNDQFIANITAIGPQLTESETTLRTIIDQLQRANELTLQGASSTNGDAQRQLIATEINEIIESTLAESNHITNGRYIFGGTVTSEAPFVATRDGSGDITAISYEGNNEDISVEVSDGVNVTINQPGEDVFTQTIAGTVDVFQTLIDIRDNLRANNTGALQAGLQGLDSAQDQILTGVSRIGAVQSRVESIDATLQTINIQLTQVLSDNIDADFSEVVVELNAESNAYQASLNAAARVIQPSLLDFI